VRRRADTHLANLPLAHAVRRHPAVK